MPRKTMAIRATRAARTGFNEAAARCRGKLLRRRSMTSGAVCFNEAAARCRGKLRPSRTPGSTPPCFNEAAARCRGKLPLLVRPDGTLRASMRPRPDAAENNGVSPAAMATLLLQ